MINDINPISFIACSSSTMFAIEDKGGELLAWGNNMKGQLGIDIIRKAGFFDKEEDKEKSEAGGAANEGAAKGGDTGGGRNEEIGKKITENIYIFKPRKVQIRS